jgi:magnesium-transporting ATPase (P-type)
MTGDGANDAPALKQSEVGIAVSNATDVAKSAASAVLVTEGLGGVTRLVRESRRVHQRITTWLLNKISRTFMNVIIVIVMFFILGEFIIDTTKLVILLFFIDFVLVAISTDNARPSHHPDHYQILKLITIGTIIGACLTAICIGYMFIAILLFGPPAPTRGIPLSQPYGFNTLTFQTFTFVTMFFFGAMLLMSVRERRFFFNSRPSWQLVLAIVVDGVLISILGIVGIPPISFEPIYFGWVLASLLAAAVGALAIDLIKSLLFKIFRGWDPQKSKSKKKSNPPV